MIPERLFARLLAVAGTVAALMLVWFAIVKPAVRDAAVDAVAEQLPAAISSTSLVSAPIPSDDSVPVTTVAATPLPSAEEGTLFSQLLAPAVPSGQTASATVEVPAGSTFRLTDFALQNPDKDQGAVVLMNGSTPIYPISLNDVTTGDKRVSWVSPVEVLGGTSLVFQLRCDGAGGLTGSCTTTMLVSGRMVTATPTPPAG
jgi:hypothetical protein